MKIYYIKCIKKHVEDDQRKIYHKATVLSLLYHDYNSRKKTRPIELKKIKKNLMREKISLATRRVSMKGKYGSQL